MPKEVIHAWRVNDLDELIAALNELRGVASSEGRAADEVHPDMRLISLVRSTEEDGSSTLEVHFRA